MAIIDALDPAVLEPLWFDKETYEPITSPKQLVVEVVDVHKACLLNGVWHSRFPIIKWGNVVRNKRYVCFVAHDHQVIYGVAIWSSPIAGNRLKEGSSMLELRRLAIPSYAPKNTATFMLKKMRQWVFNNFEEINTLISYQDTEAHHGTIYKADNWTAASNPKQSLDWNGTRKRSQAQSSAAKIRWEYCKDR